tara:strand:+ start:822 stop:965 length:144 start_codon:yes stop_codon:yes gene_type:complete
MKILIGEFELELGDKIIIDTSDLTEEDIQQIEIVLVSTCASYEVKGE